MEGAGSPVIWQWVVDKVEDLKTVYIRLKLGNKDGLGNGFTIILSILAVLLCRFHY